MSRNYSSAHQLTATPPLSIPNDVVAAEEPWYVSVVTLTDTPFGPCSFRPTPLWKRASDILVASALLLVFSPLLVCCALLIKLGSAGPVFFRQARVGARGEPFTILKFRTMCTSVDSTQHRNYVKSLAAVAGQPLTKNEHKMIPGGRLLRLTGLDELPQLWNVVCGSMSLVGPRPDILALEDYESWQQHRFDVAPGLTGLWQVSGKNRTTFQEMVTLDLRYVTERSPWLDLKIMLLTIPAIVQQVCEARDA